jgi:hypothetical protein
VPRAQINKIPIINPIKGALKINIGEFEDGKKRKPVKIDIIIILAYSAIKIIANLPLLYSVLKPETNSDSPSAKSKGVRLVSAKIVVSQIMNERGKIRAKN